MESTTFTLDSGRVVGVTEFGQPDAESTVVFAHAAPGSSAFDPDPEATARRFVRIIAIDRPGYGPSELDDGGPISVARAADDIGEFLASRGIRSVGAAGWSAGGRVALALAARHPQLVDRVAMIATPAPDDEVAWVGDDNRAMVSALAAESPSVATAKLTASFDQFFGPAPTGGGLLPQISGPADDQLLETARKRLVAMLDRSVAQGNLGLSADIVSYMLMDLGFSLADVHAKTLLLYGNADAIGSAHARWYQNHLADARVEMVPKAGHLVVIPMWDRVLSHLAPGSTRRRSAERSH